MSKNEENSTGSSSLPVKVVEELAKTLDIAPSTYDNIEQKYMAIAHFIGQSDNPLLKDAHIYAQGSINLQTVVKPLGQDEFDIDLVVNLPHATKAHDSNHIHKIIGDRLKESEIYRKMLKPLKRGWRINYASQFHLDITPAIDNSIAFAEEMHFTDTAEFVPDKELQSWKDSNPRGFAKWFHEIDEQLPKFLVPAMESFDSNIALSKNYKIDDLPKHDKYKGLLKRVVQILKRHRDIFFTNREPELSEFKPISIVITTLVAKSYRDIVHSDKSYSTPMEFMLDVIKGMNNHIAHNYWEIKVKNPTNENENFAEKWNKNPLYVTSYHQWQTAAYNEIQSILHVKGLDKLSSTLSNSFGSKRASMVLENITNEVSESRTLGLLPPVIIQGISEATPVKENRFFGAH